MRYIALSNIVSWLFFFHLIWFLYISDNENVYDDSNSKERCAILKDKDYDSMSVIRQETEGVYDHTSSANITPKPVEDVNIYDHADPVFIKQSLQIENDGVYNKCELDVKSVITNAHLKSDTNTIYDHAWFQNGY